MAAVEQKIIKKYNNRRLYNTNDSSYETIESLAAMAKRGEDFVVFDARSGDDITRSVLGHIIAEEEKKGGQDLLPITFMRQLIGFYGGAMQQVVSTYLGQSMEVLTLERIKQRR